MAGSGGGSVGRRRRSRGRGVLEEARLRSTRAAATKELCFWNRCKEGLRQPRRRGRWPGGGSGGGGGCWLGDSGGSGDPSAGKQRRRLGWLEAGQGGSGGGDDCWRGNDNGGGEEVTVVTDQDTDVPSRLRGSTSRLRGSTFVAVGFTALIPNDKTLKVLS
ncbi:uncharacterized protein LOC135680300 [Musa acuminata AAA Group]|uniref:uncharacterized protein LOC135680300 n=1 Tax=Musa acuminata AAA Group TaxID=214697 RepID=UPI0031DE9FE1